MVKHWLLGKAVELPTINDESHSAFGTKTKAAPGDDDDVDFAVGGGHGYATKTNAAPGDDDDVDFSATGQAGYLAKTAGPLPSDDDDVDFVATPTERRSLMTKTMAAPGDDDDLD